MGLAICITEYAPKDIYFVTSGLADIQKLPLSPPHLDYVTYTDPAQSKAKQLHKVCPHSPPDFSPILGFITIHPKQLLTRSAIEEIIFSNGSNVDVRVLKGECLMIFKMIYDSQSKNKWCKKKKTSKTMMPPPNRLNDQRSELIMKMYMKTNMLV
ncbi:hypothetical protein ACTXT7_012223 [Hymenolepis weldensis]